MTGLPFRPAGSATARLTPTFPRLALIPLSAPNRVAGRNQASSGGASKERSFGERSCARSKHAGG